MIRDLIMSAGFPSMWSQHSKLTGVDTAGGDSFGDRLAISSDGSTIAIGAYLDDVSVADVGAVYIFVKSGGVWSQQAKLVGLDSTTNDHFGVSVALSSDGNTCAIGAHWDDNSGGTDAGSLYIFARFGTNWVQQARVQASDAAGGDGLGVSVALAADGNTCVVGAPSDDNSGGTDAGSAYVFTRSGSVWTQQARLQASDAAGSDNFGGSVALSDDGNTCCVGAGQDDNAGGSDAGAAYIFTRSGTTWTQQTKLIASDAAALNHFGSAVALSGDGLTCAVGANGRSSFVGAAYVFLNTSGTWAQQAQLLMPQSVASAAFGNYVSLSSSGDVCAVGAYQLSGGVGGAAYVYRRVSGSWGFQEKFLAADAQTGDAFGKSVSLTGDGRICLIGAPGDDNAAGTNAGAAYVFVR